VKNGRSVQAAELCKFNVAVTRTISRLTLVYVADEKSGEYVIPAVYVKANRMIDAYHAAGEYVADNGF